MAAPAPASPRFRRPRREADGAAGSGNLPGGGNGDGVPWPLVRVVAGFVLGAAVGVVVVAVGGGQPAPTPRGLPAPAASPPAAVLGLFVEPDDGREPVLAELDAATAAIDVAVYLLSDGATIAALERAAARGVAVRVLLEEDPFGGGGGEEEVFARLAANGVDVRWSNPAFRFAHVKTIVVDDRVALIMNQNLTRSAYDRNREFGVVTTRPAEVAEAAALFAADWARGAEPPPGPLVVSPTDSREELLALIEGAATTLDVYAEVVRDEEMIDALLAAEERGVATRLLMSGRPGDDDAEERGELAAGGVAVRLLNVPYIHAKIFLVDGARVFVGSQNMTATSLDQNREIGIVVAERAALARVGAAFAADWAAAVPEPAP